MVAPIYLACRLGLCGSGQESTGTTESSLGRSHVSEFFEKVSNKRSGWVLLLDLSLCLLNFLINVLSIRAI